MGNNTNRSSQLFLIEIIIAVLFFSLGSAVCVQAFVKAHLTSQEARDLAFASSTVSSAASVVRFSDGDSARFFDYFPGAVAEADGVVVVRYGEDFSPCGETDAAAYVLRVETQQDGSVEETQIRMYDEQDKLIYELLLRWPAAVGEGGA